MIDREIVFIADRVETHDNASFISLDLEKLADSYFEKMMASLKIIAQKVTHYTDPKDFLSNITHHTHDLVISLWSGEGSRNRRALVPSICEAYSIPYVGADPYIQTVCADKHLTKALCRKVDIRVANDIIVSSPCDFSLLKAFHYPAVIKPNFEGGSIGIFDRNLVDNYEEAVQVCDDLLKQFPQLLVEEYIAGEEVSACIVGVQNHIDVFEVVRVSINGNTYFSHSIFGAESKKIDGESSSRDIITSRFPVAERNKLISLYQSLGKVELLRIDGRLDGNCFTMIEITPDCSLNVAGNMYCACHVAGYSHAGMIELLCQNALKSPKSGYQNANM